MDNDSFSKRYGYGRKRGNLIYEDAPEQVREGLREVLTKCEHDLPSSQRHVICKALRRRPDPDNWSEYPNIEQEVNNLLYNLEWFEFYDLCERLEQIIGPEAEGAGTFMSVFATELNSLFQEEYIGYRMIEGRIEKVGSEEFDQAIAQAIAQQQVNPRFEVPLRQFNKALTFRNSMPPDYPNAVKEAVNAVEGVWQIIMKMPGTALTTILSSIDPPLPDGLKKIYSGLYGYGSGSEGVRHAGIGGYTVTAEEAEFIIHTAAAAINYAINKFG